mgnify:CR=1 FL=1
MGVPVDYATGAVAWRGCREAPRGKTKTEKGPGRYPGLSLSLLPAQLSWQLAGLLEVNSAGLAHSGWSMNGLRLPWKL